MDVIILVILSSLGYLLAYHTYGKFLARKVFRLRVSEATPAHLLNDGHDFVPTKKIIVFGHHFTSIAGTGPIVGPAIGIIWGWVPALLWILLGSIFMGAVHDFGALVMSMRNRGKTIADIAARYMNNRVRYIFFCIVFLAILIVIAIFGLVIALIFAKFPMAVFPVWAQIPIAIGLGIGLYKKNIKIISGTIAALLLMYGTVIIGAYVPFTMPALGSIPPTGVWTIILLIYVFFASSLSVTTLLQPRDYINAWQLMLVMGLLFFGIIASGLFADLTLVAPAVNRAPTDAPPMAPFLFLTIACGAISGFHSLVSSGTSSKQIARPHNALFIGYGSMLVEGLLGVLIIVTVAAGIGMAYKTADGTLLTGIDAWREHYASWGSSQGLGSKLDAVVIGAANMMKTLGVPQSIGVVIMGVFIASFAGTTMDSATRIQRYVVTELFSHLNIKWMTNKYVATAFAVITAAGIAFNSGADGKGALLLWPMFGGVNQLLAALTLILITVYLKRAGGYKLLLTAVPAFIMLIITVWGVSLNEISFIQQGNIMLSILNGVILLLALWLTVEGIIILMRKRRV